MYKIIKDDKVLDVVKNPYFITFLPSDQVAITDKANAAGIVGSDDTTIYSFTAHKKAAYNNVSISKISLDEFNRLQGLLNSGKEVSADESELEKAKALMIKRLSSICKNKITAGFSLVLNDGEKHHFKLTTEDQLNLMMLEQQMNLGEEFFVYHSTNQPCKIFSKEDIAAIVTEFKKHTLYHTTYFNVAKHYIKSLVNTEQVKLFTYGTDVSDFTDNAVLQRILKNGGTAE